MNLFVISLIVFLLSVVMIELVLYGVRLLKNPERGKIRRRIRTLASYEYEQKDYDITRKLILSQIPFLNKILLTTPGIIALYRLTRQANAPYPPGFYVLLSLLLLMASYITVSIFMSNTMLAILIALIAGWLPFLILHSRKKTRMNKFHEQLPDALDLLARSLKAGHAFTTGMKLVAEEFADPVGPEFEETIDEINFGVSVSDALKTMAERIDCPDLKFFIISVIIQRETGGNLAEIIGTIANLIRERFKFQGKVRVLSAEGILSAYILIALPILIALAIRILNPDYMNVLFTEPAGRIILMATGCLMVTGFFFMKRMVQIKV